MSEYSPIISLVAPCFNEEKNVAELFNRFLLAAKDNNFDVEVVFVNDGSTDGTQIELEKISNAFPLNAKIITHTENSGIPMSWISGIRKAVGTYVCLIDSDLQNPPEFVFELYKSLMASGMDICRGVRVPVRNQSKNRVIMSKALNHILNHFFGMHSKDNKSGFLIGSKSTIESVVVHEGNYKHFQTFIGVSANSKNLKVVEIDTPFEDRRSGVSFLSGKSMQTIVSVLKDILIARKEFGSRIQGKALNV